MTAPPLDAVVKTCACGRAYDSTTWAALPLCGHMGALSPTARTMLELRHCECRSTIALSVEPPPR